MILNIIQSRTSNSKTYEDKASDNNKIYVRPVRQVRHKAFRQGLSAPFTRNTQKTSPAITVRTDLQGL